jgi:hypothetical protein
MTMERWISLRTTLGADAEQAIALLLADPAVLLGAAEGRRAPTFVVDLRAPVGGRAAVHQEVEVSVGAPCAADGEAWVPISWRPLGHRKALPSFEGIIEVRGDQDDAALSIVGTYRAPFGIVGRFGDGLVGRRIAHQSLRTLLQRLARRIDGCVLDEASHGEWRPAEYPIDLRERDAPRAG